MLRTNRVAPAALASLALGAAMTLGGVSTAEANVDDSSPVTQQADAGLSYGESGADVERLQRALTSAGYAVPDTGWFGPMTQSEVEAFQAAVGHTQSGVVSAETWSALEAEEGGSGEAASPVSTEPAAAQGAGGPGTSGSAGSSGSTSTSGAAPQAVDFAYAQLGDSYAYGGTGPSSWDCSGLTQAAWEAAGVSVPRTSQAQYSEIGTKVDQGDLRPGDLVTFYEGRTHIGIYVGDGQVVHSSRPGQPVSTADVSSMPFNGAVRPS